SEYSRRTELSDCWLSCLVSEVVLVMAWLAFLAAPWRLPPPPPPDEPANRSTSCRIVTAVVSRIPLRRLRHTSSVSPLVSSVCLTDVVLCLSHLSTEVVRVGVPSSDPVPSTGDRTAGVTVTEFSPPGPVAVPEGPAIPPGLSAGVRLTSHTRRSLDTSEKRPERTKGSSKDLVYLAESLGQKTHGQDEGKCNRGHLQEFCKDFLDLRVSVQPVREPLDLIHEGAEGLEEGLQQLGNVLLLAGTKFLYLLKETPFIGEFARV